MSRNLTGPVLFRAIGHYCDEADSFVTKNEESRASVGDPKQGATSLRLVGEGHEPRAFSTWGRRQLPR